jgi:ribosomal subunit interface protein
MNIQITSRHEKASQVLQDAITEQINGLERFADTIISCHVVLDTERVDKIVEVTVKLSRGTVAAKAKDDNLGKAVDLAFARIKSQMKKANQRLKEHKQRGGKRVPPSFEEKES